MCCWLVHVNVPYVAEPAIFPAHRNSCKRMTTPHSLPQGHAPLPRTVVLPVSSQHAPGTDSVASAAAGAGGAANGISAAQAMAGPSAAVQ